MKPQDFNFLRGLKKVNLNIIARNAIKEHERDILDLQKEQMSAGLADQGDEIKPNYAKKTVRLKREKGQPTDRVTLKDTGAFYRGQYVRFAIDHFEITSRDRKRNKLVAKYYGQRGGDIFGLSPSSKEYLGRLMLHTVQEDFRERVFKAIS